MATALEETKECPVCMTDFVDPKVLPCDHNLCANCVGRLTKNSLIKCPMCNATHSSSKIRPDFRLAKVLEAMEEQTKEKALQKAGEEALCEICCKQPVSFLCENCPQWICMDCKTYHLRTKGTKDHTITPIAIKSQEIKDSFKQESSKIKSKTDAQSRNVDKITQEISRLKAIQKNALEITDRLRKKSVKEIMEYYDALNARINDFITKQINELEKKKMEFVKQYNDINTKCQKLKQMIEESGQQLAIGGRAILDEAIKLEANIRCDDLIIDQSDIKVLEGSALNVSDSVKLELRTGGIRVSLNTPHLSALTTKTFRQQKQVPLESEPFALRVIKQQLWSCQRESCIQIFDYNLQLQRTISNKDWGQVGDVTETPRGDLVIACDKGLYEITHSGQQVSRIDSSIFTSVAFYNDRLYACTQNPPKVRVYGYNGSWQKHDEMKLSFSENAFVTLVVSEDKITACSVHDHKLITLSLRGKVLQTFAKHGSGNAGELYGPYLCNQDDNGMMLIADCGNDRLQTVDKRGHWSIVKWQPGVRWPRRALYAAEKLFVVSFGDGNKLYMYT